MKTITSGISPRRSSRPSRPPTDWLWTITQQKSGPKPSNIWNGVCVCAGSSETARGTACATVTAPNTENRPSRATGTSRSTGALWWTRLVRRSAGRVCPRSSSPLPADRSWKISTEGLPTDICTLLTPGWDALHRYTSGWFTRSSFKKVFNNRIVVLR